MDTKIIIKEAGGVVSLARKFGLSRGAVSQWRRIPANRVIAVSAETAWRYTPHQIRPDIYPHPADGLPASGRSSEDAKEEIAA
jgi:DNA-binding transcriptional regulator YdaS (Cro superfamily)